MKLKECISKLRLFIRVNYQLVRKKQRNLIKNIQIKSNRLRVVQQVINYDVNYVEKNAKIDKDYHNIIDFIYLMLKNKILNATYVMYNLKQETYS